MHFAVLGGFGLSRKNLVYFGNCDAATLFDRPVGSGSRDCEQSSTVRRSFLRCERGDALVQNVGHSFAPEGTLRTSSRQAYRGHGNSHRFDDVEAIALAVTNAFDDASDEVGALVPCRQPDPCSSGRGVEV